MEAKIDETYHVVSCCCCPQYVYEVLGKKKSSSPFLHSKVAIFPQNFVYVLRKTTTRHMVSFIDFYFHFLAKVQT